MSEIEELKKKLAEMQKKKKEQMEIKKLKSQIKQEEFSQTTGGKVFNKIADVGQGLGKAIMGAGEKAGNSIKQEKRKSVEQIMRELPQ